MSPSVRAHNKLTLLAVLAGRRKVGVPHWNANQTLSS